MQQPVLTTTAVTTDAPPAYPLPTNRLRTLLARVVRTLIPRQWPWQDSSSTAPQPDADDDHGPGN